MTRVALAHGSARLAAAVLLAFGTAQGQETRPRAEVPARAGKILGQVLRPDGTPAAGASVKVFTPRVPSLPPILARVLPEADHDAEQVVTCDGAGRFSAPARRGEVHGLLALDVGELMSDFGDWFAADDFAVLTLGPTRVIAGTVVVAEADRAPVPAPGRRVCAQFQGRGTGTWLRAPIGRLETRSGPGGAWSIHVPLAASASIRVLAEEELGGRPLAFGRPDGGTIALAAPRMVRGRITAKADGRPVAGAQVCWLTGSGSDPCTWSDAAGRFAIAALTERFPPLTPSPLHVISPAHERTFWAAPGADEAKIELGPGSLRMTVRLLAEDGSPLGGARVIFAGPLHFAFGDLPWVDVVPADGRLELGCLQRERVISGFVEVDGTFAQFVAACPSRDLALGDLKVSIRSRIEGRVVAPDGSPLPRAIVMAHRMPNPADAQLLQRLATDARVTVADRAGRFVLDGLAPGPFLLGACGPGIAPTMLATTASPDPTPVILQLECGQTVAGRVLAEDGEPVPGAEIQLAFRFRQHRTEPDFGDMILPAIADERGCFLFQGLAAKDQVRIQAATKRQGKYAAGQFVEANAGDDVDLVLPVRK